MNVLKRIDKKMEIYRNKNYDLANIITSGMIGCCIGVSICILISL
jgi:hypothetical protein